MEVISARIDGSLSQQVFDTILQTLAQPGRVWRLPVDSLVDVPRVLWLALALADVDIAVNVDDDPSSPLAELVRDATGATLVPLDEAWIAVLNHPSPDMIDRLTTGTALAPEQGARLALAVTDLNVADADDDATNTDGGVTDADTGENTPGRKTSDLTLELTGPGVPGRRALTVGGLDRDVAERLGQASGAFPQGFDTWLFAPNGDVAAIPRSTTVQTTTREQT